MRYQRFASSNDPADEEQKEITRSVNVVADNFLCNFRRLSGYSCARDFQKLPPASLGTQSNSTPMHNYK